MGDKLTRILRFIMNKDKPTKEVVEIDFDELTAEEQKKLADIHDSYCRRKVMKAAQKDEKVVERIHKFADLAKKHKIIK